VTKVYTLPAGEDWIVDRLVSEWNDWNPDITTSDLDAADTVWILAGWKWNSIPREELSWKRVVVTVHHVVPEKFDPQEFMRRDAIASEYLTYGGDTANFMRKWTSKPVTVLPYWANGDLFKRSMFVNEAKVKYGLPTNSYVVGSFQRDTEGSDGRSPKLEKGPDLFADHVEWLRSSGKDVHVLLAGWRRQYVLSRLISASIPYTYFERPSLDVVNDLYQACDLYVVSSRHEGGPQSLIECGLTSTPVVSRDVGIARNVLPPRSINDDLTLATPSIPDVNHMKIDPGFSPYRRFFIR
jgi:glycosyltransferase involved in cell wall biosynthesis